MVQVEFGNMLLILALLYGMIALAVILAASLPIEKKWWDEPADEFGEVDVLYEIPAPDRHHPV